MSLPLAERLRCVEAAWRIVSGAQRAPGEAQEREALARGLDEAARLLRWIDAHREALGAGPPASEVSLREKARCLDAMGSVLLGTGRAPERVAEREYLARAIGGARATLQWARTHEYRLREIAGAAARVAASAAPVAAEAAGPRKSGCAFPNARRAAMRCAEPRFQVFLGVEIGDAQGAAAEPRRRCGVASRRDFDEHAEAWERWRALEAEFSAWLRCVDDAGRG